MKEMEMWPKAIMVWKYDGSRPTLQKMIILRKKSVICYGPDSQSYMYNVHTVKDMDKENKDNKVSTWKQFLPEKYLQLLWECLEKA